MSEVNLSKVEIIQYVPYMTFVHPSFWHSLSDMKLDVDKLSESNKKIWGRFSYRGDLAAVFEVDGTSFNNVPENEQLYANVRGTLMNKNTIEEFKAIDKAALLNAVGKEIWDNVKTKAWITKPTDLLNFIILSFADLKKFHFYYWFAFPAPSQPTVYIYEINVNIMLHFNKHQIEELSQGYKTLDEEQKGFFVVTKPDEEVINVATISSVLDKNGGFREDVDPTIIYFGFTDPSNGGSPGWPLRLFLAALLDHCPILLGATMKVLGLRANFTGGIENSRVFTVKVPQEISTVESAGWVGWERNDKGNFGPKLANMAASLDPVVLAETSSHLNIKLMKWRLVPDIDVNVMKSTKCLLFGAGTLGCHVARDLLAWGFRHITFIDSGKVSFSNPTRQVLFTFTDCLNGGRMKAEAASDAILNILPSAASEGIIAHIPMPGHPIGEALKEETISNIMLITEAIAEHDVVFLLLDTREARWLPTLLAAYYGKVVINAALGFDSYLVMRHGVGGEQEFGSEPMKSPETKDWLSGANLGCYFCNDVTAPGNSLKDRTLDQQCTVTRPGVAAIASALAVELLVGILQHPQRGHAPAMINLKTDIEDIPKECQTVLGPVPHSIRGFLHSYQTIAPTCAKFKQCIACSNIVINRYKEDGIDFLFEVFNSGYRLEEVTGLRDLHLSAEMTEILTLSDDEEEE
uniref:Ubiquitin-like modifier-activating enzyme ATG7 n=1 Tax=Heliothis virescens TaxID=7102 RepID=A0A2A4K5C7_HELVI